MVAIGKSLTFKGRFFRKSLITILLITSLPGLLIGIGIYVFGSKQITGEFNKIHSAQFEQSVKNIDDQFANLEMSISHWAFEPQFDENLQKLDTIYGYNQVRNIVKTLLVMKGLNPLISEVRLYLQAQEPLVFTVEGYKSAAGDDDARYRNLLAHSEKSFWTQDVADSNGNESVLLVHKIPGGSMSPFGIFIVSINLNKLEHLLASLNLNPDYEGTSFLMKADGGWITHPSGNVESRELDDALRTQVLSKGTEGNPFVLDWKGKKFSVSYGMLSRLGSTWTYVAATPVTSLTAPVVIISRLILSISFFGLVLALLLSWLASQRLYQPVGRLVKLLIDGRGAQIRADKKDEFEWIENEWHNLTHASRHLQARLEAELPHVRESFLLQLVQGYLYNLSEEDLRARMEHLGWTLKGKAFCVAIIQLHGFSHVESRFSEGDQHLVTFAAANIIQEIAEHSADQIDVINFRDLTVGLLFSFPGAQPVEQWKARLHSLFTEITNSLNTLLYLQVMISLSRPADGLEQIPFLMEEARQTLRYRDLQKGNQILDSEELGNDLHKPSEYPFQLENKVLYSLRLGMEKETSMAVEQFVLELRHHAGKELWVQQGMLHLLGSVQHAIMQTGTNLYELYEGANLYEQLFQLKEPDEIVKWFQERVLTPFLQNVWGKQDIQTKQMVEKVMDTIHQHYMENISLDAIAENCRISIFALSRMFKQVSGLNFIDYLTKVRMEKAIELLRDTELKLTDVAERVGYQQNYFSRIFKKYAGVTPSRFREKSRGEDA